MKHNWTYKKLGEIANIYQPKTITVSSLSADGKYPVYGANGIVGRHNEYNHESAELLVGCRGSCGSITISAPCSWINGNAMVIHPKDEFVNEISSKYLYYVLRGIDYSKVITGGTIPQITRTKLAPVEVALPPLDEQKTIVAELDGINHLINLQEEQLREYDRLAQSLFYTTFGDPVSNPKGWEVKKLKEVVHPLCPISYGIVQPGDGDKEEVPVVRPIDLRDSMYVGREGLKYTTKSISDSYRRTILRGEELLICVRGTTGILGIAKQELKDCNVTRGIVPLFFADEITNKLYMYMLLKTRELQDIIAENTFGATLKQINIKALRELPIMCPPLTLQQTFAAQIEAIEQQKALIRRSLDETRTLLAARMQYYFNS